MVIFVAMLQILASGCDCIHSQKTRNLQILIISLLTSCSRLDQQAQIKMRSHGLGQLVEDKYVVSCQQTCCKLIVKTCYPQASCKLFLTSCNKYANDKLQLANLISIDCL